MDACWLQGNSNSEWSKQQHGVVAGAAEWNCRKPIVTTSSRRKPRVSSALKSNEQCLAGATQGHDSSCSLPWLTTNSPIPGCTLLLSHCDMPSQAGWASTSQPSASFQAIPPSWDDMLSPWLVASVPQWKWCVSTRPFSQPVLMLFLFPFSWCIYYSHQSYSKYVCAAALSAHLHLVRCGKRGNSLHECVQLGNANIRSSTCTVAVWHMLTFISWLFRLTKVFSFTRTKFMPYSCDHWKQALIVHSCFTDRGSFMLQGHSEC